MVANQYFVQGLLTQLKLAEAGSIFDLAGHSILPSIDKQTKWQYAKTNDTLQLKSKDEVFEFELPDPTDVTDIINVQQRKADPSKFGENANRQGTAQIHRANPGMIYMTLQEGTKNPTFSLVHKEKDIWKFIPKSKKASFEEGIKEAGFLGDVDVDLRRGLNKFLYRNGDEQSGLEKIIRFPAKSPLHIAGSTALGAGAGYGLDKLLDKYYRTEEEKQSRTKTDKALFPLIGGAAPLLYSFLARNNLKW